MAYRYGLLITALLVALPSLAAEKAGVTRSPEVAVIMDFEQSYSPVSVGEMEKELDSIMSSCHVNLQWRVLNSQTPKEVFPNLVVARFTGRCRYDDQIPGAQGQVALGLTHISEGDILPFSEVDCDRLRRMVGPRAVHNPPSRIETLLGRAMARVLAHEVYHILGKTRQHGQRGIAKATLSVRELLEGRLRFENEQSEAIYRNLVITEPLTEQAAAQ